MKENTPVTEHTYKTPVHLYQNHDSHKLPTKHPPNQKTNNPSNQPLHSPQHNYLQPSQTQPTPNVHIPLHILELRARTPKILPRTQLFPAPRGRQQSRLPVRDARGERRSGERVVSGLQGEQSGDEEGEGG